MEEEEGGGGRRLRRRGVSWMGIWNPYNPAPLQPFFYFKICPLARASGRLFVFLFLAPWI